MPTERLGGANDLGLDRNLTIVMMTGMSGVMAFVLLATYLLVFRGDNTAASALLNEGVPALLTLTFGTAGVLFVGGLREIAEKNLNHDN